MLAWLEQLLVRYPELALFLVIAAGYWIGAFKIAAFSLGPVTGALFCWPAVGAVRCRARIRHDQIFPVPAFLIRDRLFGWSAVHASVET
jgi:hypothetical protein